MKRNALIRIIIWSIVLAVLLLILWGAVLWNRRPPSSVIEATLVPTPITEPAADTGDNTAFVTETVNIRRSPSLMSEAIGVLEAGSRITIDKQENVDGVNWALLSYPETGWIVMQYVSAGDLIQETMVTGSDPEDKITLPADKIREIDIEWAAGDILIQSANVDAITFSEDNVSDPQYAMRWIRSNDELKIRFSEDNRLGLGFSSDELKKDLTILVPQDWVCESLSIECASASVEVNDMTIREVDFDGASGACEFENCTVGEIDLDTASGDIRFVGSLETLDCDAASASVYAVLTNVPSRLDMDTMSGDLEITLPEEAGFTLAIDAMSNDFESEFETTMKNGNYVCGDGRCRINVDALSGDVVIRKAVPADS